MHQHIHPPLGHSLTFRYASDLRLWESDYRLTLIPEWARHMFANKENYRERNCIHKVQKQKLPEGCDTTPPSRAPCWQIADYLILAGNCIRLVDGPRAAAWLGHTARFFNHIIVVPGPGEFYGDTMEHGSRRLSLFERDPDTLVKDQSTPISSPLSSIQEKKITDGTYDTTFPGSLDNVVFLQRGSYDIPRSDITIMGCTLWSVISSRQADAARKRCEAFNVASSEGTEEGIRRWDIAHHNLLHRVDSLWLQHETRRLTDNGRRIIIVTHHAPSLVGTIRPEDQEFSEALGSNCLALSGALFGSTRGESRHSGYSVFNEGGGTGWDEVRAWIYGGTGLSGAFETVESIRLLSYQPARDGTSHDEMRGISSAVGCASGDFLSLCRHRAGLSIPYSNKNNITQKGGILECRLGHMGEFKMERLNLRKRPPYRQETRQNEQRNST